MKKINLFFAILLCAGVFSVNAQIKVTSNGYVGMGATVTPVDNLHITNSSTTNSPGIRLTNSNNVSYNIKNCLISPWDMTTPNAFCITDQTGNSKFEIRASSVGIWHKLYVGWGYSGTEPVLELPHSKFMMLRTAIATKGGILFHETGTYTSNDVQYGARIEYDETNDWLALRTSNNYTSNYGIVIHRATGNVGIGAANWGSDYKLKVTGDIYCTGTYLPSDSRYKKNVKELSTEIEKLSKVKGVSYEYIEMEDKKVATEIPADELHYDTSKVYINIDTLVPEVKKQNTKKYGFIAQDIQAIYPELVKEDEKGYLAIDYIGFIPILVENIKQQQTKITELETLVSELQTELDEKINECCKTNSGSLKSGSDAVVESATTQAILYQNNPNPFYVSTTIGYSVPEKSVNASIFVYNMNGLQLKEYPLVNKGTGTITIEANSFEAGLYLYSLIIDGKLIDTKTMALVK